MAARRKKAPTAVLRTFKAVGPPVRSPYRTYLENLKTAESRRTKAGCLDRLAALLAPLPDGADVPDGYGDLMPWHLLRYEDTARVRLVLSERFEAGDWS